MSTALIKSDQNNMALSDVMTLGSVFKSSGYFKDVREQSQAVVKILYGQELGFSPVVSMMGIHIIEGKPALSSNLMGAMVKRSVKYNYKVDVLTDTECVLSFTEGGQPVGVSTFDMADASRAGVNRAGSGWSKYPRNMLFARALSNGVKLYCPELSACPIYVPEELGAEVNEEGAVVSHPVTQPQRTAEVRTFGKPNGSANPGSGEESKGSSSQATEKISGETVPVEAAVISSSTVPAEEPAEYITIGQQKNFHKECRAAVKPARSLEADDLIYKWLGDNGYRDKDKLPSASMIPASGWLTVRNQALAWLRVQ